MAAGLRTHFTARDRKKRTEVVRILQNHRIQLPQQNQTEAGRLKANQADVNKDKKGKEKRGLNKPVKKN